MHTEGHDMGRDVADHSTPGNQLDPDHPGYETTDVNVGGVLVFLGGLGAFLVMFFFVCYGLGILINNLWEKEDGTPTKWAIASGNVEAGKGKNLASNPEMEQKALQRISSDFPEPRLDTDDGLQATADLHAREDLLLDHYSSVDGQPGVVRIPVERAMQLIAERGLPISGDGGAATSKMTGTGHAAVQAPLTTGFARTGYELTTIETRKQKLSYSKAEAKSEAK